MPVAAAVFFFFFLKFVASLVCSSKTGIKRGWIDDGQEQNEISTLVGKRTEVGENKIKIK